MQSYDVIIIGAGPAGIATARALSKVSPGLAARTLLLDQRPNMLPPDSGGASTLITGASARALEALELDVRVPEVALSEVSFSVGERARAVALRKPWALVDRQALDARMFHQVSCALETRLGEQVKAIDHQGDWVRVETQQRACRAQVVIGADGARGALRGLLGWPAQAVAHEDDSCGWVAFADIEAQSGLPDASLRYDLSMAAQGQGSLVWYAAGDRDATDATDASPRVCAGQLLHSDYACAALGGDAERDGAAHLRAWLQAKGWQGAARVSAYQRPYRYSAVLPIGGSRVLLVGDAAGVVPLLDDGLCQCLEYGCFAAYALSDAFERKDFNFQRHGAALRSSALGRELSATQRMCARLFGPDRSLWLDRLLHPRSHLAPMLIAQASGDTTLDAQRYRLAWTQLSVKLRGGRWL
jgi:flavin-dependent dehydrogenase